MTDKDVMKWDLGILNKLIGLTFKKNPYITTSNLRNLQRLINRCNFSLYQNKSAVIKRVEFLQRALSAKLDEKFEDESIILNYCRPDFDDPVFDDIINNLNKYKQLNHSEIQSLHKFVEDRLQFGIISNLVPELREIIDRIEDGECNTYAEAKLTIEEWIGRYNIASREIASARNNDMLDLNDPNIQDKINDIIQRLGTTSSIIITGIRMLNEMLSPGFRPGKLYIFLGLSGGFKSAMLLKIIVDCAKFNAKTYRPRKEGYKPVVLYLTMENTKEESFARMYNMTVGNDDMENHSAKFIVDKMTEQNIIGNDDMGILLAYRANMSINTNDIRNMIDELDSQGKEVVLLSFDYIKRIKPVKKAKDEKEELKNVTNELHTLASDYLIPVVSAQQLNRSGLATVNAAARDNKADLAKLLGAENVGSAYEVFENADMTIILNLERRRSDQQLFLTFFRVKERYRPATQLNYFNQPFVIDNDFMLFDDILEKDSKGVISLATDIEGVDADMIMDQSRGRRQHNKRQAIMDKATKTEELFNMVPLS
jgi:hypothetical protein